MLSLIKRLDKKQWLLMIISVIFIALQVFLDLKIPDYMSNITSLLQTEGTKVSDLYIPGGKMLLCAFGSLVSAVIVGYVISFIASSFSRNLRKDIFSKVMDFGMEEIKKFSTSSLITRTTNDVTQVRMLLSMGLQMLIKAPITAVWAILKILGKSFEWSTVTAVAVCILLLIISVIVIFAIPKFKIIQKLTDNLNRITLEGLKGIRVVKAYNAEEYQESKFEKANDELASTHLFTQKIMSIMSPGMYLIMNGLTLSIYFIGAILLNSASMMDRIGIFSDMIVFSSYAMQVVMSFMMLSIVFIMYPRASVSAKRILEVLNTSSKIHDGSVLSTKNSGTVEFKNVSFKYPDAEEYMLRNISFKANKGDEIAIIGSTGCGKSTLINLIPRFYDASSGEVLVDGVNVKDYNLESLYNKISYVPQKTVIFSGTVRNNICYGNNTKGEITDDEMRKSAEVAQASDFINKMENGYDAHIAQGGTNISGGQKQRLAIARAIARDPEIYIFDDSFSALDYKTDYLLRKKLKEYTKNATLFIVAQRIGTIKNADKIIVLDDGVCVGMGKHQELLKNCKVYKEIALSQLSKEELENE